MRRQWLDALAATMKRHVVRNSATPIMILLDEVERCKDDGDST